MEENKPILQPEDEHKEMPSSGSKENLPNNEPQVNTTSTDEPIASTETSTKIEQPSTVNPQPLNPAMEVHHHAHTARKKWTHYFWEFLMLFLAVFCGFMAENIREHKIEQHRAKEFSKSLVQDLQNDTTAINTEKNSARVYIAVAANSSCGSRVCSR